MLIPRRNSGPKVPIIDLLYHYLLLLILTMNLEYSNLKMMCSLYRIVSPGFVLYVIKIPSRYWKERDVAKLAVWCLQIPDSVPDQFWCTDLEKFVQRFISLDDHLDSLRINVSFTLCLWPIHIIEFYWTHIAIRKRNCKNLFVNGIILSRSFLKKRCAGM